MIKAVLNVEYESEGDHVDVNSPVSGDEHLDEARQCSTVFEMAGQDRAGLLADVVQMLTHNGCEVRSAAVWTYNSRVAFVVSVLEKGQPVRDGAKLQRLSQLLLHMMDPQGDGILKVGVVKGLIHYERRLHQLMLTEEEKEWVKVKEKLFASSPFTSNGSGSIPGEGGCIMNGSCGSSITSSSGSSSSSNGFTSSCCAGGPQMHVVTTGPCQMTVQEGELASIVSPKYSKPEVSIQHYNHLNYWLVTIRCKDRNKLFFDTVCTLSDLNYDVYHGAIDSEGEIATQLYYIRPRFGDFYWDVMKATKLRVMLEAAIQRRFPKGLKVHVQQTHDHCLSALTAAWKSAGLWITRAKVRAYSENGHTLYVMDANGQPPDPKKVQQACQAGGGLLQGGLNANDTSPPKLSTPSFISMGGTEGTSPPAAGVVGGLPGEPPGAGVKFFYAFLQRNWDGSPSSLTSV